MMYVCPICKKSSCEGHTVVLSSGGSPIDAAWCSFVDYLKKSGKTLVDFSEISDEELLVFLEGGECIFPPWVERDQRLAGVAMYRRHVRKGWISSETGG